MVDCHLCTVLDYRMYRILEDAHVGFCNACFSRVVDRMECFAEDGGCAGVEMVVCLASGSVCAPDPVLSLFLIPT